MRSWIKLILLFIALWGFMKIAPLIYNRIGIYRAINEKSKQLGIDNSALFYTEDEQTSIAEQKLIKRLSQ